MALILDIVLRQKRLVMSLFEAGATVQSYEETSPDFAALNRMVSAILALIEKNCRLRELSAGAAQELKKNGQSLFDDVVPVGIKSRLQASSAVDLTLQLDEELVFIPWELLFDGQDFLCRRFNIGRCVKTCNPLAKLNAKAPHQPLRMLIVADPAGNLPAARAEATLIRQSLSATQQIVITSKTKDVLCHYLQRNIREYDILHYAGHADFDVSNPQNSCWLMADGKLTSRDFTRLGASTPLPQLVFMNACQTVLSPPSQVNGQFETGLFGWANTFLLAGGRYVIGTLARVPDDVAAEMARLFYQQLLAQKSVGAALRNARQELSRQWGEDDLAWAGYVFYGRPAGTIFDEPLQDLVTVPERAMALRKSSRFRQLFLLISLAVILLVVSLGERVVVNRFFAKREVQAGSRLLSAGQYELARQHYERALKYAPDYGQAALDLSRVYNKLNDHKKAADVLKAMLIRIKITQQPEFGYVLKRVMAQEFYHLGEYRQAFQILNEISSGADLKLEESRALYELLGNTAAMSQQYGKAQYWYERSQHIARESLGASTLSRFALLRADNALEAHLSAMLSDKKDILAEFPLAVVVQEYEEARQQAANEKDVAGQAEACVGMAKVYQVQGDWAQAIRQYQNAVTLWETLPALTWEQEVRLLNVYLELAWEYVDPKLNFTEAWGCLNKFDKLSSKIKDIPDDAAEAVNLVRRRFEYFLSRLALKGYKNSDLYKKAGAIYDRFVIMKKAPRM